MHLITIRGIIKNLPALWRESHKETIKNNTPAYSPNARSNAEIARLLDALDTDTATPDDVAAIMGNNSWTDIHCNECKQIVPSAVQIGEEPDYESYTAIVCLQCLGKAASLIKANE